MDKDIKFMKEAIKEAQKAYTMGEVPIGAVIVKDNKIIARAHNTKNSSNSVLKHAELIVIEKASKKLNNWRLVDCELYVTMIPCPMCASAINQSRLSRIIYGTTPDYVNIELVENLLSDTNYGNDVILEGNVLSEECGKLLSDFFVEKR